MENVAIFWDYENCPVPCTASGYAVVDRLRTLAELYGCVRSLKAYLEVTEQTPTKTLTMRSELQSSGVSLVDCPHNGRKDVADKMMIVDMLAHALDNPAPSTIILITGDRDFAYAMSILRLRRYRLVLVTLFNAHVSLTSQANVCLRWNDITMSITNEISSNVFSEDAPPPSHVEGYPFQTVTNLPCNVFNQLRPETVERYKQLNASETPRPGVQRHLPTDAYTPDPTRPPEPLVRPTSRDVASWKWPPFPLKTGSPLTQSNNTAASYTFESESTNPTIDSSHSKPCVTPADIDVPFPAPVTNSTSSDLHENAATKTNEATAVLKEPSLLSGPSLSTSKQGPQPAPEISIERAVPPLVVPVHFKVLVQCLQKYRLQGIFRPLRSVIGFEIAKSDVFKKVGVNRFKQYLTIAVKLGIVELGGKDGGDWIFLKPHWVDAI